MIDPTDKQTQQIALDQPEKRKRGRPASGRAMTPAEKQRAYRERLKSNVTGLKLTNAEATAIGCMLQDKAREISTRALCGGPVTNDELESANWLWALAEKIGRAERYD